MPEWDAIIIGGGPAGLAAGIYLGRAKWRTLLLEQSIYGGYVNNIEVIENYPGFSAGIAGPLLGSKMAEQARKYGVKMKKGAVTLLRNFPNSRWIKCQDGSNYTAAAVIIAGGSAHRKLGVPGEEELLHKGVFSCALCDGDQYTGRLVAVVGGGDAGVSEALYLAKMASHVFLLEAMPRLTATAVLQQRLKSDPKIEIHCGAKVKAITGSNHVECLEYTGADGQAGSCKVDGVLIDIGLEPNTKYLKDVVALDVQRRIVVNDFMETEVPGIFAAGDIRSGSAGQVVSAVGDGAAAGISAQKFLQREM